jgi:hypothetical protein
MEPVPESGFGNRGLSPESTAASVGMTGFDPASSLFGFPPPLLPLQLLAANKNANTNSNRVRVINAPPSWRRLATLIWTARVCYGLDMAVKGLCIDAAVGVRSARKV